MGTCSQGDQCPFTHTGRKDQQTAAAEAAEDGSDTVPKTGFRGLPKPKTATNNVVTLSKREAEMSGNDTGNETSFDEADHLEWVTRLTKKFEPKSEVSKLASGMESFRPERPKRKSETPSKWKSQPWRPENIGEMLLADVGEEANDAVEGVDIDHEDSIDLGTDNEEGTELQTAKKSPVRITQFFKKAAVKEKSQTLTATQRLSLSQPNDKTRCWVDDLPTEKSKYDLV